MPKIDVTGEVCPRPVLIVREQLSGLSKDEELVVIGDYEPAKKNLTRTCEKHNYNVRVQDTDSEDEFCLVISQNKS